MSKEYPDCLKRQNEIYKGVEQKRCIDRESEFFREFVHPEACVSCPVRKMVQAQRGPSVTNPPTAPGRGSVPKLYQLPVVNNPGDQYPPCIYRLCKNDSCECSITGLKVDPEICNRCDAEVKDKTAGSLTKLQNYFGAVRKWIAHGRPVRSDERMRELFEQHCKNCDRYDAEAHACKVCGCKVNTDSKPLSNKLKMATEVCPLGRFGEG